VIGSKQYSKENMKKGHLYSSLHHTNWSHIGVPNSTMCVFDAHKSHSWKNYLIKASDVRLLARKLISKALDCALSSLQRMKIRLPNLVTNGGDWCPNAVPATSVLVPLYVELPDTATNGGGWCPNSPEFNPILINRDDITKVDSD
ncbi:hypothetical protein M8C21_001597, partial [Ambrosia artemisiifolia]